MKNTTLVSGTLQFMNRLYFSDFEKFFFIIRGQSISESKLNLLWISFSYRILVTCSLEHILNVLSLHFLTRQAPIQVFGIDGRYATALYSAASKQKQLDVVEKELDKLKVRCRTHFSPPEGITHNICTYVYKIFRLNAKLNRWAN